MTNKLDLFENTVLIVFMVKPLKTHRNSIITVAVRWNLKVSQELLSWRSIFQPTLFHYLINPYQNIKWTFSNFIHLTNRLQNFHSKIFFVIQFHHPSNQEMPGLQSIKKSFFDVKHAFWCSYIRNRSMCFQWPSLKLICCRNRSTCARNLIRHFLSCPFIFDKFWVDDKNISSVCAKM